MPTVNSPWLAMELPKPPPKKKPKPDDDDTNFDTPTVMTPEVLTGPE